MESTYQILLKNFGGPEPSEAQRASLEGAMRAALDTQYGTAPEAQELIGGCVHAVWDSELDRSAEVRAFESFVSQVRAQLRPRMHFAWDISIEPDWAAIVPPHG